MSTSLRKNLLPGASPLAQQQEDQRPKALDPQQSVWVSASAGSGKTTLLTERVLRLLLQNRIEKRPKLPNILCLTYTKAAAAEMQNRIHTQLEQWATLPEAELQAKLEDTFAIKTNTDILKEARRLFAATLERPDAIRIMTMHAFCQMILNRFPHEAGLAPHFTLLEGEQEKLFHKNVLAEFYAEIKKSQPLADAFNTLGYTQSTTRTTEMLEQVFYNSGKWDAHFAEHATQPIYAKALQTKLNLSFTGSEREWLDQQLVPEKELLDAAQFLQIGSVPDKERGNEISYWVKDKENRIARFDNYVSIYITDDGAVRKRLFTNAVAKAHPEIDDIMKHEAARVQAVAHTRDALRFYHQQIAFYTLSHRLWQLAKEVKRRHAQLTYDDMILTTLDLVTREDLAPWVLYKLDGGIDHMLIDEAQDTSPQQWDIILKLLEEMLSGNGARADDKRTLFVVGDEKQSIYSFQGANRNFYLAIKQYLKAKFESLGGEMPDVERIQSFRSTSSVLKFVDEVFNTDETRKGVSNDPMQHYAHRTMRGYVELWSPIKIEKSEPATAWAPPLEREDGQTAYVELAARIANKIHELISGAQLKVRDHVPARAIKPEDIIILLQARSHLLSPIIRALKERNIPVAGIDRMVLHEQVAVQDVLGMCRFTLLPQDDLALAEVLRGPFIRISDEQLFALAHKRNGTMWQALQNAAKDDAQLNAMCDYLKHLLNMTDIVSSFAFLSHLYTEPCPGNSQSGKHALIQRLGKDAIDPLEQLLSTARLHDTQNPLSLQLFVRAIAQDDSQLKREQSNANGEVRIMTTHGAKGLEAPIVIIPDLMREPSKQGNADTLYWNEDGVPFVATPVAKEVPLFSQTREFIKDAQAEENRRLLYVALTRAADVLIICSAIKNKDPVSPPWYTHITAAMERLNGTPVETSNGIMWTYGDSETISTPTKMTRGDEAGMDALPAWVMQPIAPLAVKQAVYNPSALIQTHEKQLSPPVKGSASSFVRGRLLHRLLQLLPTIPDDQREAAAARFLIRNGGSESNVVVQDVREVMAVLRSPVFADVFSNAAQAEVPIIGAINGKQFSGQIDRLLITDTEVLVVDFKTNRPPPKNLADVDEAYVAQMACYTALLEQIYPGRTIRAGLLWTHTLTLMELGSVALQRGMKILDNLSN